MHSHKLKIDLLKLNTAVAVSVEATTFPHIFEYSHWQGYLSSN